MRYDVDDTSKKKLLAAAVAIGFADGLKTAANILGKMANAHTGVSGGIATDALNDLAKEMDCRACEIHQDAKLQFAALHNDHQAIM